MGVADIINEVLSPPPARGRKASPISAVVRRELNQSDIEALWNIPEGGLESRANPLVRLRHQHHFLARLLAEGRKPHECSLITGMGPSRISVLQNDPAFADLVKYYKSQAVEAYVNVHERLAAIGISSLEELMDRLLDDPETFSNRELMELATTGLDRIGHGPTSKVSVTHTVLTEDVLTKLKAELAARQNGTVRPLALPPHNKGAELGPVIDEVALAETETPAGSQGAGPDLREEGLCGDSKEAGP